MWNGRTAFQLNRIGCGALGLVAFILIGSIVWFLMRACTQPAAPPAPVLPPLPGHRQPS
jgi:hypothetical protein